MRRAILGIVVTLAGAGCTASAVDPGGATAPAIQVNGSPSPFTEVTAGAVRALVPEGWDAVADSSDGREGFFASPRPHAWGRMDGSTEGIAATWVDATQVGVPSDFYYLAATGPILSRLLDSPTCTADSQQVLLDNLPSFASGKRTSPGDYMARGEGTCRDRGHPMRWAYFVAAPGFGPVRRIGIPRSGLYVVVAVLHDGRTAQHVLQRLIDQTRFGDAGISDFVHAARRHRPASAVPPSPVS